MTKGRNVKTGADNRYSHVPARVLACLNQSSVRVIVYPGEGLSDGGVVTDVPIEIVPPGLRIPNSKLVLIFDRDTLSYMGVARKGDTDTGPE